jgi:hypothetical protein
VRHLGHVVLLVHQVSHSEDATCQTAWSAPVKLLYCSTQKTKDVITEACAVDLFILGVPVLVP